VIHGKAEMFELPFRKFETLKEAFDVHGALIATGAPYGDAFERWEKDHDLPALVAGVAKRYATDPNYGSELMALIAMPVVRAAIATVRKSA
jgi:flagellum-specific peptidoglycan hydrolase FlgJ